MSWTTEIQAITFDVGGTLIEPWPSVGHVYADVAERHGMKNLSPDTLNQYFAKSWKEKINFNHTKSEWAALVEKTFAGLGLKIGEPFFNDLYNYFAERNAWRIYNDVIPTLEFLRERGLRIAAISNWDERLRPLLADLKLQHYFETIVVSCEVGFPKPSPVIFEHSARKLGLPHDSILHIGDSLEEDIEGARSVGLKAFLLGRKMASNVKENILSSLADLQNIFV